MVIPLSPGTTVNFVTVTGRGQWRGSVILTAVVSVYQESRGSSVTSASQDMQ